jgi:alkaline phosphatase D
MAVQKRSPIRCLLENTMKIRVRFRVLTIAIALAACGAAAAAFAQQADYGLYKELEPTRKIVGPLVGDVTDTTARIWAYAGPRTTPVILEIAELQSPGLAGNETEPPKPFRARLEQAPAADKHHEVEFHVEGLQPMTRYAFAVRLAGDADAVQPGIFTTAPAKGQPSDFRLAIASCFGNTYERKNGRTAPQREYVNHSWRLLMDRHPDLQLIIGDNVYANSTDYNHLWDSYTLERVNNGPFAESIRTMPTYAVWDDHDYGPNNSDGTAKGKEQSALAFDQVFANPPRPAGAAPGIYTRFGWGGVDFFLLDGRYNRSPNDAPEDENKKYLGDEQFKWLIGELKSSQAPFKLLVNGSTWATSKDDGWRRFPHERRRLWKEIVANGINGVVFVSGDIHRCDLPLHYPEVEGSYFMPEITSSGLGSHGKHDALGFVVVDFDMTAENPSFTARVIDGKNRETLVRTVWASDLKVGAGDEE